MLCLSVILFSVFSSSSRATVLIVTFPILNVMFVKRTRGQQSDRDRESGRASECEKEVTKAKERQIVK